MTESTPPSGVERRRAPRARADFAIRLAEQGDGAPAQLKDLSTNGLCCTTSEPVREMTLVRIGLEIPGVDGAHDVQGAVVRCAKLRGQNPPTYEVAVYFTDLEPATRTAIDRFVKQALVS